jgi:hypothetical protein
MADEPQLDFNIIPLDNFLDVMDQNRVAYAFNPELMQRDMGILNTVMQQNFQMMLARLEFMFRKHYEDRRLALEEQKFKLDRDIGKATLKLREREIALAEGRERREEAMHPYAIEESKARAASSRSQDAYYANKSILDQEESNRRQEEHEVNLRSLQIAREVAEFKLKHLPDEYDMDMRIKAQELRERTALADKAEIEEWFTAQRREQEFRLRYEMDAITKAKNLPPELVRTIEEIRRKNPDIPLDRTVDNVLRINEGKMTLDESRQFMHDAFREAREGVPGGESIFNQEVFNRIVGPEVESLHPMVREQYERSSPEFKKLLNPTPIDWSDPEEPDLPGLDFLTRAGINLMNYFSEENRWNRPVIFGGPTFEEVAKRDGLEVTGTIPVAPWWLAPTGIRNPFLAKPPGPAGLLEQQPIIPPAGPNAYGYPTNLLPGQPLNPVINPANILRPGVLPTQGLLPGTRGPVYFPPPVGP